MTIIPCRLGEDQTKTGEILRDFRRDGTERPWKKKKEQSLRLAEAYHTLGFGKKALRIKECGSFLKFLECPNNVQHGKRLKHANFCRVRLCPTCQWRKSILLALQVRQVCHCIFLLKPTVRFLFLTLTVPNVRGDKLSRAIDELFEGWKRLTKRKELRRILLGYFRALEVTYNRERDSYHPHFHILLVVPSSYFCGDNYIKRDQWLALWKECVRDETITQVDIRSVKSLGDVHSSKGLAAGIAGEVAKYSTKPDEYLEGDEEEGEENESERVEVIKTYDVALRRRRLIGWGGLLREIHRELGFEDVETADLVDINGEVIPDGCKCLVCSSDLVEHIYMWRIGLNEYMG